MKICVSLMMLLSNVMANAPLQEDRNAILELHVQARATVIPPARNMMLMSYSLKMEGLALKWVNRCEFNHPNVSKFPLYKNIGQNLALSGGYTPNLTQIVQDWYKERKYYSYANNSCSRVCSHYTQMVSATTLRLGCAMKQCDQINLEWPRPIFLTACQYEPA
ncbi:unnamed protein product [Mesocestoides corti]|uniref:SCP domain-containing protein n=1 Tax=Mesocestoides corti TaxID=53468 RepID=A0A0R3ULZ3_MESCO|nr:unnamed protein product [Mesocestoides corti]